MNRFSLSHFRVKHAMIPAVCLAALLAACATSARATQDSGLVTVGEWNLCAEAGACPFHLDGAPSAPATEVSWDDAQVYLTWLSIRTGRDHHLPTLAQWTPRGGDVAEWLADCHDDGLSRCSHRAVRPVAEGGPEALSPSLRLSDVGFRAVEN